MKVLNKLAEKIHKDNYDRGFYDTKREIGTLLMLVVSELAEALEADRKYTTLKSKDTQFSNTPKGWLNANGNPKKKSFKDDFEKEVKNTFNDEIADAFIRLFDLVGYLGIDIEEHIRLKLAYNKMRGYKHGKNY